MNFELGKEYIVKVSKEGIIPIEEFKSDRFYDKDHDDLDFLTNEEKTIVINDVLEKIKAEILDEAEYAYADFDEYKADILYADPDELPNDDFRYGMERAVEIINKYKAHVADINVGKIAKSED